MSRVYLSGPMTGIPGLKTSQPSTPPPNNLPTWAECALRVDNSDFIAKRVSDGGYGPEPDSLLATELHRFIYEYDDADPYRSAWFLHRLELVLEEARREASNAKASGCGAFPPSA